MSRIGRRARTGTPGVGEILTMGNSSLVHALLALRSRLARYHPERHYMRGPGPKTLSKLGEMYRDEAEDVLHERLPDEWVALTRAIEDRRNSRN
jgi:hypothetical protein